MRAEILLPLLIVTSFVAWSLVAWVAVVPRLGALSRRRALVLLTYVHLLSFQQLLRREEGSPRSP